MSLTRKCPGCGVYCLMPVYGTDGKMGRCPSCGYTGPMKEKAKC